MSPYDLLKSFFNKKDWDNITKIEKGKNFFIINRIMSIGYPLQANAFNNTKIDPVPVIDFWKETLNKKYKATPGWFFTSTEKKSKKEVYLPKEDVINFIKNRYEISNREIMELSKYFTKEFKEFCKSIETQIT